MQDRFQIINFEASLILANTPSSMASFPATTENAEDNICLCESIKPVFKVAQIMGIAPIKFQHKERLHPQRIYQNVQKICTPVNHLTLTPVDTENENSAGILKIRQETHDILVKPRSCHISAKYCSLPSFINFAWLAFFAGVTPWVMLNVKTILTIYFEGTDLYTFGLQVQLLYSQALGILVNSALSRWRLQKVWEEIQQVFGNLQNDMHKEKLKTSTLKLKRIGYCFVTVTCIAWLIYAIYFIPYVFKWCFNFEENKPQRNVVTPPCPLNSPFLFLQKIGYCFLIVYNTGFAMLFSGLCGILRILYREIGLQLATTLDKNQIPRKGLTRADKLENLRMSHESLCKVSRWIGECCGPSILLVCVAALLSITCGVYTGLLRMGVRSVDLEKQKAEGAIIRYGTSWFYVLADVQGLTAVSVLLVIVVSGQLVKNAAGIPCEVIGESSHRHLTPEEKHQISIFLQKCAASSTGISACYVTNIGMTFLAAAATNVTTYILVILQFRLSVEPQVDALEVPDH